MSAISEKRWKKEFEEEVLKKWEERWDEFFSFNRKTEKPIFSIDTPPPYVNAPVHIGHAASYTLMDFIARYKRAKGYEVLFPLGLDRNGLPIEVAAEKEFGVDPKKVGRERFIELCKELLDRYSDTSSQYFKRLGISFNSYSFSNEVGKAYFTDSSEYRALTQATFIRLWKRGLIYRDKKVTNFCPRCRAAIADAEIEYLEKETYLNYIKFRVKESKEEIVISTTRPELLCTCEMVIFNPSDERYGHLKDKHAIVPIYNKEVPIKAHPYAKQEFGTGLVMMCSFGDYADIRFFREENLPYKIAIDEEGKLNEHAGFLAGLSVEEARRKIIEELERKDLLVKREKIFHRVPSCGRCKTPLEFIELEEWYLKQLEFKEEMLRIAKEIRIFSEESRQRLIDWINSISMDWCLSRRRYYATEIPIWYCKNCNYVYVPEDERSLKYYIPWKEKPPIEECPRCKGREWEGEKEVFDTWFDSSISPLFISGYLRDNELFKKIYPCSLRPQGKDIIRTWLYYTLLRCYQLTGKPCFRDVYINHHVVDEQGKKMSKSLGNVISPAEILEEYGAEPFRLWVALTGDFSKGDFRCSKERIANEAKTLTKLWNIARFISLFGLKDKPKDFQLTELDQSIIFELNSLIEWVDREYENYNFFDSATRIINFMWEEFASHYLEMVKPRVYNREAKFSKEEQESAIFTLNYLLETLLKLLHPIIPFITSKLYSELKGNDIEKEEFPKPEIEVRPKIKFDEIKQINSKIWKEKKEKGKSLKDEIAKITLPEKFKPIERDLKEAHNIREIEYGGEISILV